MKRNIIVSLAALAALLGLTGCEGFLNADNKSAVSADKQFATAANFETLLNEAYFKMRSIYTNVNFYCAGTDLFRGIRSSGDPTLEAYKTLMADNATVKSMYTSLYGVSNAANAVLYYADKSEDFAAKDRMLEEARFVRAYAYYIMSQQFGGVPLIKEYIASANTSYPRATLAEIYDFLVSELGELENGLLPDTDHTGRASKLAAKALLAKVYLAKAWDMGTSLTDAVAGTYTVTDKAMFATAAAKAAEVAALVPLTMSFDDKWSPFKENNDEVLFAIQYDRATSLDTESGGHSHQTFFGNYLGAVALGLKYSASNLNIMPKVFYLFDKGDERYDGTFMTTIYNYDGQDDTWFTQGYWGFYNTAASKLATMPVAFYFPAWYVTDAEINAWEAANAARLISTGLKNKAQVIHTAAQTRWDVFAVAGGLESTSTISFEDAVKKVGGEPVVRKFDDPQSSSSVATGNGSYRDVVVLNASEIYLCAAEAYLLSDDKANALTYLNAVRDRAKATHLASFADYTVYDYENDVRVAAETELDVILDERVRETIGEFYRWMDLRRTKQLVRYNLKWNASVTGASDMIGSDGQYKWYRPIPADEIGLNTGMTAADQNPGYMSAGAILER